MDHSDTGRRMGHEAIGVVEAADVRTLKVGDLVVMPFAYSDGTCVFCREGLRTSGIHGGFFGTDVIDGAQAEAVRVPQADGTLFVLLSVRITAVGGHSSGTARLWYNGQAIDSGATRDAGSRFDATIGGATADYFLRWEEVRHRLASSFLLVSHRESYDWKSAALLAALLELDI